MSDRGLYSCDTPRCTGLKAVVTPDGYVCRRCANQLEQAYESEPELVADGGTTWAALTGFQRDILEAIAHLESIGEESYGLAIKERLEKHHSEVLHGRLYQNLDGLIEDGLLERDELDGRTNSYTLTTEAEAMLEESIYRRADACGLQIAATDGGEPE
ncbi:transcriptional regulator PadR family protein [Natrialba chahannaoensis JCM 10990]|uniref:Transcriptional regulator PadR family protein n=1 Tax=Natrialba chahannaoensis JCM 10990 TaxID=1227492 RepID=M0B524_9EURY|nr:helix-turn-helix transcriptional regulator [Natrialba chahannaoensis]ELZ05368.1 transcriptional regulator PadR family protein [Natrialba chahannaoensis JCM 10990]